MHWYKQPLSWWSRIASRYAWRKLRIVLYNHKRLLSNLTIRYSLHLVDTDLDLLEMVEGTWYQFLTKGERQYFKFYMDECKVLQVDLVVWIAKAQNCFAHSFQNLWGGTATLVSTELIPLDENAYVSYRGTFSLYRAQWSKQPWVPHDSYWIGPGHAGYRPKGWYYITSAPRWPSSFQQKFKIRVRTMGTQHILSTTDIRPDPPVCGPLPTPPVVPGPTDDWLLLEDSRPLEGSFIVFWTYIH